MTKKNKKTVIVSILVVVLLAILVFCVLLPYRNKTKAPKSEIKYSQTAKEALDNKNYSEAVENYEKAIIENPTIPENYVDKSTAEYASGDKEAAKATVIEGLTQDPNNELLKARLEALEKGTFDSNIGAERQ
jgi:outer membrane protein assembly factor BamD (BamD/ComL family)